MLNKLSSLIKCLALFILLILFASCRNSDQKHTSNATNVNPNLAYKSGDDVLISAHRGGKSIFNKPENCLETIKFLYGAGISMFEIDIRQTKDDVFVLMHDKSLERTTDGNDLLERYNFSELQEFNLVDAFDNVTSYKIPSLENILRWAKDKDIILQLDLKAVSSKALRHFLDGFDMADQLVIIVYNLNQLPSLMAAYDSNYRFSINVRNEKELASLLKLDLDLNRLVAFTGTRRSSSSLYMEIHKHGLKCILGTLGNIDGQAKRRGDKIYSDLVKEGIDILATDRPMEAKAATKNLKTL